MRGGQFNLNACFPKISPTANNTTIGIIILKYPFTIIRIKATIPKTFTIGARELSMRAILLIITTLINFFRVSLDNTILLP